MIVLIGGLSKLGIKLIERINKTEKCLVIDKAITEKHQKKFEEKEIQFIAIDFNKETSSCLELFSVYWEEYQDNISQIIVMSGVNRTNSIFSVTPDYWDECFNVGLKTPVFIIKKLIPHIKEGGTILMVSSMNSIMAHKNRIDYGSMKAAINQFVKNLSIELECKKIRVNAILPGYISETDNVGIEISKVKNNGKDIIDYLINYDEVVDIMLFLMSSSSKIINGQAILCDKGFSL